MFPLSFMTMKKIILFYLSSNRESDSQKPVNQTTRKQANHTKKLQRTGQLTNFEKKKFLNRQF